MLVVLGGLDNKRQKIQAAKTVEAVEALKPRGCIPVVSAAN